MIQMTHKFLTLVMPLCALSYVLSSKQKKNVNPKLFTMPPTAKGITRTTDTRLDEEWRGRTHDPGRPHWIMNPTSKRLREMYRPGTDVYITTKMKQCPETVWQALTAACLGNTKQCSYWEIQTAFTYYFYSQPEYYKM